MSDESEHVGFTSETNFWHLYRLCRKIPSSKDNILAFILSFAFCLIGYYFTDDLYDARVILLSGLSTNITSWSVSLIAFILAGYSIFASTAPKDMQVAMQKFQSADVGMSHLKKIHCIFIKICIDILMLIGIVFFLSLVPLIELYHYIDKEFLDNKYQITFIEIIISLQCSFFCTHSHAFKVFSF